MSIEDHDRAGPVVIRVTRVVRVHGAVMVLVIVSSPEVTTVVWMDSVVSVLVKTAGCVTIVVRVVTAIEVLGTVVVIVSVLPSVVTTLTWVTWVVRVRVDVTVAGCAAGSVGVESVTVVRVVVTGNVFVTTEAPSLKSS